MNRAKIKRTFAVVLAIALLVPAAALAQSSNEGYGGPNNVVAGIEDDNTPTDGGSSSTAPVVESSDDSGSLPFTGADLGVLLAAGAILLGLGLGLRRLTHRPSGA